MAVSGWDYSNPSSAELATLFGVDGNPRSIATLGQVTNSRINWCYVAILQNPTKPRHFTMFLSMLIVGTAWHDLDTFRSCAMIRPDLRPICENMLMAEGFVQARALAVKFVTLYSLSSELLSKQVSLTSLTPQTLVMNEPLLLDIEEQHGMPIILYLVKALHTHRRGHDPEGDSRLCAEQYMTELQAPGGGCIPQHQQPDSRYY